MYDTQGRADGFNAIFIWDLLIRGRRMATLILYGEISLCSFWLPGLFFLLVLPVLWPMYMYIIPSEGISAYYMNWTLNMSFLQGPKESDIVYTAGNRRRPDRNIRKDRVQRKHRSHYASNGIWVACSAGVEQVSTVKAMTARQ